MRQRNIDCTDRRDIDHVNNATIAPTSTCRVRVRVVSNTQGQYTNTIPSGPAGVGSLKTRQGVTNTSPVTAIFNVQAVGVTKTINPATIQQGDTSLLTITLQNPTGANYIGVGLVDNLPTGVTISGSPATNQCGGTISWTADSITLTNGTIPSGNVAHARFMHHFNPHRQHNSWYPYQSILSTMTGPVTNAFPTTATLTVQTRSIGVINDLGANFVQGDHITDHHASKCREHYFDRCEFYGYHAGRFVCSRDTCSFAFLRRQRCSHKHWQCDHLDQCRYTVWNSFESRHMCYFCWFSSTMTKPCNRSLLVMLSVQNQGVGLDFNLRASTPTTVLDQEGVCQLTVARAFVPDGILSAEYYPAAIHNHRTQ